MSKQIQFGDEARLGMFLGMEKVAKVVSATM
jgi:chaperonin GroEL (HSP60 family)